MDDSSSIPALGNEIELKIHDVAYRGSGIARRGGTSAPKSTSIRIS